MNANHSFGGRKEVRGRLPLGQEVQRLLNERGVKPLTAEQINERVKIAGEVVAKLTELEDTLVR